MIDRAVKMEGTVSVRFTLLMPGLTRQGEHGIGLGKKACLEKELGPETMQVMRTLKRSLDPQ